MDEADFHHFRSILRQLREMRDFIDPHTPEISMLGYVILADNIDWLDCFIAKVEAQER